MTQDVTERSAPTLGSLSLFNLTDTPPDEMKSGLNEGFVWMAVWAGSESEALAVGMEEYTRLGYDPECGLRAVSSMPEDKILSPRIREPHIEGRTAAVRQLGWACEGDDSCDTCGLYEMDSEQFRVCDECRQCRECGCICDDDQ